MIHEVLTQFDQPCLRPRMRENHSTIQQRTLLRIELEHYREHNQIQLLASRNIPYFSTLCIPTLSRAFSLHQVTPVHPHIFIHLVQSLQTHLHLITLNIYRDISKKNLSYSIRKSNITIIYQLKNILYSILYKKIIYTNQEFRILPNTPNKN